RPRSGPQSPHRTSAATQSFRPSAPCSRSQPQWSIPLTPAPPALLNSGRAMQSGVRVDCGPSAVRLAVLLSQLFCKRVLMIDLPGPLEYVNGKAVVIVRGSRERLSQCLLDGFD